MQTWWLSDVDSGYDDVNGDTVYVMYKDVDDNETNQFVIIPDDEARVWIADEAVQAIEVVFTVTGSCYWINGIQVHVDDGVDFSVGGFNPVTETFYSATGDGDGDSNKLTLPMGDNLAILVSDDDRDRNSPSIRVTATWPSPMDFGSYVSWSCGSPPYPVPDVGAWVMFAVGSIILGLVGWRYPKRVSANRYLASDI